MQVWSYVFVTTRHPKRVLRAIRHVPGVLHADALFGTTDVIAIVAGDDIARMDAVIDDIAGMPDVSSTDSRVARWIDGAGPPAIGSGEKSTP